MNTVNAGRYKKNNIPWNKGVKGIHLNPATEFKKGEMCGSDHYSWKGGLTRNVSDCHYQWNENGKRTRRPRDVFQAHCGSIPEGYVIYHLDGDMHNDVPSNLVAVQRKHLIKLNRGTISIQELERTHQCITGNN